MVRESARGYHPKTRNGRRNNVTFQFWGIFQHFLCLNFANGALQYRLDAVMAIGEGLWGRLHMKSYGEESLQSWRWVSYLTGKLVEWRLNVQSQSRVYSWWSKCIRDAILFAAPSSRSWLADTLDRLTCYRSCRTTVLVLYCTQTCSGKCILMTWPRLNSIRCSY